MKRFLFARSVFAAVLAMAAGAAADTTATVKQVDGRTIVTAPTTKVDASAERTKVRVDAPDTRVRVDTETRIVRIRVPYFNGDIRW
jgi:hypothetical protein